MLSLWDLGGMMQQAQIDLAIQELLTQIDATNQPANEVINGYTRSRRYIGSKDRRAITEGVWQILRSRPIPDWIKKLIPDSELEAMKEPAQTILRCNGDRIEIQQELLSEGIETDLTPLSPWGLILKKRVNLTTTQAYQTGMIEIQDEGSQLLALATNVQANEAVLDYCSGAGGKSLALGQMMQNKGIIVAHDVSSISLKKLQVRAKRAGLSIIQTTQHPTGEFDHVVVDAPCSGTGTWRRQPDAPFKLTEKQMKHYVNQQKKILDKVVKFVKSKGYLHYMTCSLMESENQIQMRAFLHRHKDFRLIHHSQFTPAKHHTDGFFIATFQKQ